MLLGSARVKAADGMLIKLTPGLGSPRKIPWLWIIMVELIIAVLLISFVYKAENCLSSQAFHTYFPNLRLRSNMPFRPCSVFEEHILPTAIKASFLTKVIFFGEWEILNNTLGSRY